MIWKHHLYIKQLEGSAPKGMGILKVTPQDKTISKWYERSILYAVRYTWVW